MIRTQIQLTERQAERLKEIARAGNKSIAGVIREALDKVLDKEEPGARTLYRQALKVVGKYRCGVSDIGTNHDEYLEKEFGS